MSCKPPSADSTNMRAKVTRPRWLLYLRRIVLLAGACYLAAALAIAVDGLTDHIEPADAIVVLGNAVSATGTPHPRLAARLDAALELYLRGAAPLIIVSGGIGKSGFDEAVAMSNYLVQRGVPSSAIIRDNTGINTRATAVNVAGMAQQYKIKRVLIASQYFHISRTRLAFQQAGLEVAGSVHARYFELRDVYSLAREVIGFAAYSLRIRG